MAEGIVEMCVYMCVRTGAYVRVYMYICIFMQTVINTLHIRADILQAGSQVLLGCLSLLRLPCSQQAPSLAAGWGTGINKSNKNFVSYICIYTVSYVYIYSFLYIYIYTHTVSLF